MANSDPNYSSENEDRRFIWYQIYDAGDRRQGMLFCYDTSVEWPSNRLPYLVAFKLEYGHLAQWTNNEREWIPVRRAPKNFVEEFDHYRKQIEMQLLIDPSAPVVVTTKRQRADKHATSTKENQR
jgi:hypothetical protein